MSQKHIQFSFATKRLIEQTIELERQTETEKKEQLQEYYVKLFDQLRVDGVEPSEVYAIAKKLLLEEKAKKSGVPLTEVGLSSWFWEVHRKWYVNPVQPSPQETTTPLYTLNEQIIQRLKRTKEICDEAIPKFETIIDISRVYDKEQSKQFLQQWDQILQMAEDGFNEKTKIPNYTQLILLYYLSTESSVTNGAKVFMKARVELMEELGKFLTAKQAGKFQTGDIKDQLPILKPYSRDTAIFLKYWGIQCIKCNSWCVKDFAEGSKTKLKCIDCENIFDPVTISKCRICQIPLYKEDLLYIIENKNCKNCKEVVHLPQELVDYARS